MSDKDGILKNLRSSRFVMLLMIKCYLFTRDHHHQLV